MKLLRSLSLFVLLAVLSVTGISADTFSWRSATTSDRAEGILRSLIKTEHARVCANTLSGDARLKWMARYRATDMVVRGYFSHTTPEGNKVWDFMPAGGISFQSAAEILAWNSYPDDYAARAAYNQFMGSSGHRAAIQSCDYTRLGVGDYKAGSKRMFVVLFTRP